jgi:hypothetical protein
MQDENGNTVTLTHEEAMSLALQRFENGTYLVIPSDADVDVIEVSGKGEQFEKGINIGGKQITIAILKQELATRDAAHQTKGSTGNQMSLLDVQVYRLKCALIEAFISDVLKPQVRVNFGDDYLAYMPKVSLGDSERKDWATDAEAFVSLVSATRIDEEGHEVAVLTYSQVQTIAEVLGIPPPNEDELKEMRARKEQLKDDKNNKQPENPQQKQQGDQARQEKQAA